ncbi:MAG: hypothetical protein ACI4RR_05770, partial [Eubacterium sp.]
TTKKQTKKATTKATTKKATTTTEATTTTTTTTTETTTESTTQEIPLTSLDIYASTYELCIGDTVRLEYSVEPSGAPAVVGYFCDEEGIIEIGQNGDIKAIGEGTATVVVCANNDLYAQCDFTVGEAVAQVTTIKEGTTRKVVGTVENDVVTTEINAQSALTRMGVNVNALMQNKELYIIPLSIVGFTFIVSVLILIIKKFKA